MRCIIEKANPEVIFNLPNFIITDPIFEKEFTEIDNLKETKLQVILCDYFKSKDTPILITNKTTGAELKQLYADKENYSLDKYKIRLFLNGQEIKNEQMVYMHKVSHNSKIVVNIAELS